MQPSKRRMSPAAYFRNNEMHNRHFGSTCKDHKLTFASRETASPTPLEIPEQSKQPSQSRSRSRPRHQRHASSHTPPLANDPSSLARSPAEAFLSSLASPNGSILDSPSSTSGAEDQFEGLIVDGWKIGRTLGVGAFSVVRACTKSDTGEKAAVKIIARPTDFSDGDASPGMLSSSVLNGMATRSRAKSTPQPFSSAHTTPVSFSTALQGLTSAQPDSEGGLSARPAAVKRESSSSTAHQPHARGVQTFLDRETSIWSNLAPHPNVMPLLKVHTDEKASYIFMPLCEGGNLLEYINDFGIAEDESLSRSRSLRGGMRRSFSTAHGPDLPGNRGLPLDLAKHVFSQIANGLAHLHAANVTHRDIKLENILLGADGCFRIADFGLAQVELENDLPLFQHNKEASAPSSAMDGSPMLGPAMSVGSLNYCPPELLQSSNAVAAPTADTWALGCVLYAIIDGNLPFADGFEPRLRMKIIKGLWEPPRSLERRGLEGEAVLELLKGCLTVDVAQRWNTQRILESCWLQTKWPEQEYKQRNVTAPSSFGKQKKSSKSRSRSRGRPMHVDTRGKPEESLWSARHSPYAQDGTQQPFRQSTGRQRSRVRSDHHTSPMFESSTDDDIGSARSASRHRTSPSYRRSRSRQRSRERGREQRPDFPSPLTEENLPFPFDKSGSES